MIFNEITITESKEFEKVVLDILPYIEMETNIQFDHSTLDGIFAWVTTDTNGLKSPTICLPTEFYRVYSKNYSVRFIIRYCPCECCNRIVEIELTPSNSYNVDDLKDVTTLMEGLLPDICVYPDVPYYNFVFEARERGMESGTLYEDEFVSV